MKVIACRWDEVALRSLVDGGASVDLVIDAWESANRRMPAELVDRLRSVSVVSSFDSLEAIGGLATRFEGHSPDKVLSLAEQGQQAAAYLAVLLGLARPTVAQSVAVRDKVRMKTIAVQAGLECARQLPLGRGATGVDVIENLGTPVVVKPVAGMGTVDTAVCHDADAVQEILDRAGRDTVLIAEAYVAGAELHVDAVFRDGTPAFLSIGKYLRPRVELVDQPGHLNGSMVLAREGHRDLYGEIEVLLNTLGGAFDIMTGVVHAEFFWTSDGRIIFSELATRPGGGAICELVGLRGADLRELWIEAELGQPLTELRDLEWEVTGWLNVAPREAGTVTSAPSLDYIETLDGVVKVIPGHVVGDEVEAAHTVTWSWRVFIGAASAHQFRERVGVVEAALAFTVEPRIAEAAQEPGGQD